LENDFQSTANEFREARRVVDQNAKSAEFGRT
jgi:hypothetical protein